MKRYDRKVLVSTILTDDDEEGQPFLIQNTFFDRHGEIKKRTIELNPKSNAYRYFYIEASSGRYEPDKYALYLRMDSFQSGNIAYAKLVREQLDEIISLGETMKMSLDKEGWIEI